MANFEYHTRTLHKRYLSQRYTCKFWTCAADVDVDSLIIGKVFSSSTFAHSEL